MFFKFVLFKNVNRQSLVRHFKDFNKCKTTDFSTQHQCKSFHNICTIKPTDPKNIQHLNLFTLRRIFCTKPPTKANDRGWLSIRRQHRESKKEIKRLFSLAKKEKWYLVGAIGCLCVSSSVTLGVPHAIGKIMDMIVMDNFPKEKMQSFCLILFGVFIAGSLANFGRIYLMNSASKFGRSVLFSQSMDASL